MSEHGDVHVSPNSTYFAVFFALCVLTVVTAWVAFYDFGPFNDVVALGIAFTKASLVVLFFMHVKYSGRLVKLIVIASLVWLGIMFGLTIIDYVSREAVTPDPTVVPNPYESFEPVAHGGEGDHGDESAH